MATKITDVHKCIALALLGGCSLLLAARLIHAWPPTRACGRIIEERMYNASANWRLHPTRSAAELSMFLGVLMGHFARHKDPISALQTSTISGIIVCLGGEFSAHVMSTGVFAKWNSSANGIPDATTAVLPTIFVVYAILVTSHYMFADVPSYFSREIGVAQQILMACFAAVLYLVIARVFLAIPFTRKFGEVFLDRVVSALHNWEVYVASDPEQGLASDPTRASNFSGRATRPERTS